jgi:hypothetical protein
MASGDLTASAPVAVSGYGNVKAAVDALNLTAVTDRIMVVPIEGRDDSYIIFKIERAA